MIFPRKTLHLVHGISQPWEVSDGSPVVKLMADPLPLLWEQWIARPRSGSKILPKMGLLPTGYPQISQIAKTKKCENKEKRSMWTFGSKRTAFSDNPIGSWLPDLKKDSKYVVWGVFTKNWEQQTKQTVWVETLVPWCALRSH